jgi:hypothetical protein
MKGKLFKRLATIVGIFLLLVLAKPMLSRFSEYYFKSPTIFILILVGIVVLVYVIVFFKEIFFKRKS